MREATRTMKPTEQDRLAEAIEQFNRHEDSKDGAQVTRSLCAGLGLLCDLLYGRMHFDVEEKLGTDSMLVPVSEMKTQKATREEIEVFQVVESAAAAAEYGYTRSDDDWYLQWLGQLRLGESLSNPKNSARIADYRSKTPDARRLALTDVLLKVLPESRRAPLVLFRLVPLAVHVATALAFGDQGRASELRGRQIAFLPAITDCHKCRGAVLDNEEMCDVCGNPLWRFEWLNVTD